MQKTHSAAKNRKRHSQTRTPKLYRWADMTSEALIYFTILWGPWAFGTVHDWAIVTMNIACYGIGMLLLLKWGIRYATDFYPSQWMAQKNDLSTFQPPKRDWRTKAVAALTVYMLGYILISILNARATVNHDFNFFEYQDNYIKWLPHTYDKLASIQQFYNFLALACCFWGVRDWLLEKTRKERFETNEILEGTQVGIRDEISTPNIPIRLNRLLWVLCISGGLLALVGIVQRLDGTPKLLWIYEREKFTNSIQSFGPFGYRGNGASYLNMILPLSVGFFLWAIQLARGVRIKFGTQTGVPHYTLIPAICLMFAAPFASLSRGGCLILVLMVFCWLVFALKKRKLLSFWQRIGLVFLIVTGFFISYGVGWKAIYSRFSTQILSFESDIEKPNNSETIQYIADLPPPPYERSHQIILISDSRKLELAKSHLSVNLQKDGFIRVALWDYKKNSSKYITYTNCTDALSSGRLDLTINREFEGFEVHANGSKLHGIVGTIGDSPPNWDLPVIPNEVNIYCKTILNSNAEQPFLKAKSMTVTPLSLEQTQNQNTLPVELNFDGGIQFNYLISRFTSRGRIYESSWQMAKDFSLVGCGAGSWSNVYHIGFQEIDEPWDAWAHCDWLEFWITFGFFGTLPGIILIGLCLSDSKAPSQLVTSSWLVIGLNLGIAGCVIHAIFDFPLQVISTMHLFVILCAMKMNIKKQH